MAKLSKAVFCVTNILFLLISVGLAAAGTWFFIQVKGIADLRSYERYQLDTTIHWIQAAPLLMAGVGMLALLVTCCGFCGLRSDSKGMLLIYNIFLTLVILLAVGAGVVTMMFAYNNSDKFIKETIWDVFTEAGTKPLVAEEFGKFEQHLHCCGPDKPQNHDKDKPFPKSCCDPQDPMHCDWATNQRRGCVKVATFYTKRAFMIATVAAGLAAFLGVVSLILAASILRARSKKDIVS